MCLDVHPPVCVGGGLGGGVEGHWRGINSRKLLERMFHRHVCVWGGGGGGGGWGGGGGFTSLGGVHVGRYRRGMGGG